MVARQLVVGRLVRRSQSSVMHKTVVTNRWAGTSESNDAVLVIIKDQYTDFEYNFLSYSILVMLH